VSNTVAARAAILVPLIGYWVVLNDWLIKKFSVLSPQLVGQIPAVPWQLFATFFGLWLVGAGSGVYLCCGPGEVKLHATSGGYAGEVAARISFLEMERVCDVLAQGDDGSRARLKEINESVYLGPPSDKPRSEEDRARGREQQWRDLLQAHFEFCNRRFAAARFAVAVLYGLGFTALAIPSVVIFYRVSCVAMRRGFAAI
jgi:hypothetical protein